MLCTKLVVLFTIVEVLHICYGINYKGFDGYLKTLNNNDGDKTTFDQQKDTEKPLETESDKSNDEFDNKLESEYRKIIDQVPTPLSLRHVKDSMDKDTACCMLGQIAADKGYHCHAKFYSNQIMIRNKNRAHNRKMSFYGRDKIVNFGEKLMLRFEKCLANKSDIFHRCCHLSAMEKDGLFWPHYNTFKRHLYNLRQINRVRN